MSRRLLLVLGVALVVITACGSTEGTPAPLPTQAQIETGATAEVQPAEPSASPTERPTLVPRATLPPVPTATQSPSSTPLPPSPTSAATQPPLPTPLDACGTFTVDESRSVERFRLGEAPTVAWTAVEGAVSYRVRLWNDADRNTELTPPIFTAETSYTFESFLFSAGATYGWEVYPVDNREQQMCIAIGFRLVPQ